MPTITLQHRSDRRTGRFVDVLFVGRAPENGLVIDDPKVSRVHAAILRAPDGSYTLLDLRSKTGTSLNGSRLTTPARLSPNDQIRIGRAHLRFLPRDLPAAPLLTNGLRPNDPTPSGTLLLCPCGSPAWSPAESTTGFAPCPSCHRLLPLPRLDPSPDPLCPICQWPVPPSQPHTTCPTCHLSYHRDCWAENHGCSTYGCGDPVRTHANAPSDDPSAPSPARPRLNPAVVTASLACSLAVTIVGLLIGYLWWLTRPTHL